MSRFRVASCLGEVNEQRDCAKKRQLLFCDWILVLYNPGISCYDGGNGARQMSRCWGSLRGDLGCILRRAFDGNNLVGVFIIIRTVIIVNTAILVIMLINVTNDAAIDVIIITFQIIAILPYFHYTTDKIDTFLLCIQLRRNATEKCDK